VSAQSVEDRTGRILLAVSVRMDIEIMETLIAQVKLII
jgi:hypothetical protein